MRPTLKLMMRVTLPRPMQRRETADDRDGERPRIDGGRRPQRTHERRRGERAIGK
jgi:hypothetical protein